MDDSNQAPQECQTPGRGDPSDGRAGQTPCPISIGVAGWSYPDWEGIVYGRSTKAPLAYVSRFVDCIEVNSTFYRPPSEQVARSWLDQTADRKGFFFTAKVHRSLTHEGRLDPATIRQFHLGLGPMLEAGRLRFLLAQFRYDFADGPASREHVRGIVASFTPAFALAVEVRHRSWEHPDALAFLADLGVTVCHLDYPVSSQSFNLRQGAPGLDGYFRLHGRNARAWFARSTRDETYDYTYSPTELDQIRDRMADLAKALRSLTVIMNNHYRGAELANAIELKHLVTGLRQSAPEGLVRAFPNLARAADPDVPEGRLPW